MSEKNEQCSGSVHVWPDDGDTCKCGARTHADVEREAKREFTITEKLERMGTDRLVRGLLTPEDVMELLVNRQQAMCEHKTWKCLVSGAQWTCDDCGFVLPKGFEPYKKGELHEQECFVDSDDATALVADFDSFGFPQVAPGVRYMSRRLRAGLQHLGNVDDLHALMDSLGARSGPLKERITELVTRTKEMRAKAEEQCTRAQKERQALAACPGKQGGGLWEELFMFYLPRCYAVSIEAPTEEARLEARVKAAVRMANDAFRIAWENRA